MFVDRVNALKAEVVAFASLVGKMMSKGITGLLNRDVKLFEEVINADEPRCNRFELELDEQCTSLIAQFQPKAKDLRTILMILKMNNDLERLGDEAVNICESGLYLVERPQIIPANELLKTIEQEAVRMFKDSITSFINEDTELAMNVCEHEPSVDNLRNIIIAEMIAYMKSNPLTIEQCLHIIRISRSLERIADLSTNICEDVTYLVSGKVIKHPGTTL